MALRENIRIKGSSGNGFNKTNYPPEMTMWASMMDLALNDYVNGVITGSFNEHYQSANEWIFGEDQNYINSFNSICYIFNIDPDSARIALKADPVNIKQRLLGKFKKKGDVCTTTS